MRHLEWFGLYAEQWKDEIVPEAFAHPAKFSRGLIRKIYRHMLDRGYIKAGDSIVDPFGGVALGGLDAMRYGLHWYGMELERRFYRIGQGMDCPGFDKAYWRRYVQRGRKWNELNICPDCARLLDASRTDLPLLHWFGRVTREIPEVKPHRYFGNIETWQQFGFKGTAELIQGDSRRLASLLGGGGAAVSSPPFVGTEASHSAKKYNDPEKVAEEISEKYRNGTFKGNYASKEAILRSLERANDQTYGNTPGQLGVMREGNADGVITSPPYADAVSHQGEGPGARHDPVYHNGDNATKNSSQNGYGLTAGNLGNLDGSVTSPPFGKAQSGGGLSAAMRGEGDYKVTTKLPSNLYQPSEAGQAAGNLSGMDSAVTSPHKTGGHHKHQMDAWNTNGGGQYRRGEKGYADEDEAQLGGETFWTAARVIVEQLFIVLRPGAYGAFVTGDYVRDKKRVYFGRQWLALCEAVGFEAVEHITAWKREPGPVQQGVFGNDVDLTIGRVSFFRKLANNKANARHHWDEVSEERRTDYLRRAEADLVERFETGKLKKRPTKKRILVDAHMMAWIDDSCPDYEEAAAVWNEDVWIVRKPAIL